MHVCILCHDLHVSLRYVLVTPRTNNKTPSPLLGVEGDWAIIHEGDLDVKLTDEVTWQRRL